ncbi:MAG TPA: DUF115 domain-containing protein [Spirochaetota bacterium]|nr:DUF115 domain-containing protein [Spirochaetota bacterium]
MYNIEYFLEPTKENFHTLRVIGEDGNTKYIHSKYYPTREASYLKDIVNPEKYDVLIILGIGLGYHLDYLTEIIHSFTHIICIDIHDYLINACIPEHIHVLLQNPAIETLIIDPLMPEQLYKMIPINCRKGIQVIDHQASFTAFPSAFASIKNIVQQIIQKSLSNQLTSNYFAARYCKNAIINIPALPTCYPVMKFNNIHQNTPCIIVAPGPSLEESLPLLYKNQNKVYIISVDSAVKVLSSYGIEPDYIIAIDPQPIVYAHLFGVHHHATIISMLTAHPAVFSSPVIVSLNTHPLCQLIEQVFPATIGSIDSKTGSVLGDAVSFAQFSGFSPIGIAGADFSFPHFITYARSTEYHYRYEAAHTRLSPIETSNMQYIFHASKGTLVEQRYSRKVFVQYRNAIDALINTTTTYQIKVSGLQLKNAVPLSTEDFFTLPAIIQYHKKLSPQALKQPLDIHWERLYSYLHNDSIFNELLKASKVGDSYASQLKLLLKLLLQKR